jgi:hypothetical protein
LNIQHIYTGLVLFSLFFPLHHHHHHPSCLPVETTIERRGRSETTYIIKTNFSFFVFLSFLIHCVERYPHEYT